MFMLAHFGGYTLRVLRVEQVVECSQAACTSTHPSRVERGPFERKFNVDVHEREVRTKA